MPFDPSSLLDVSHLVTFLGGATIGAAGQYMADRFTDRRRKKELASEARKRYLNVSTLMPDLIAELRTDLGQSDKRLVREFVVLVNERINFLHDRTRFEYYETQIKDLQNKVRMLIDAGYIRDVSTMGFPIYRMSDEFVAFLHET